MASSTRQTRLPKSKITSQFLIVILEVAFFSAIVHSCSVGEREILMKFKEGVQDPCNRLITWTVVNANCCSWEGISCDNQNGQVIKLDLRNNGNRTEYLKGEVDPSLCYLKQIQYLDLSYNYFDINILNFIDCFQELRYLNLSRASLFGTLPQQLGNLSRLHTLDLSQYYGLTLYDATWLGHLSSLNYLDLSGLHIQNSSAWVQSLNNLPSISVILCKFCSIDSLPQSLPHVNFTSLLTLDLSQNSLSTQLPGWLFQISNLENLYLRNINFYKGRVVPNSIGNLKKLKVLDLSANEFNGSIPKFLRTMSSLECLYMSQNKLNGSVIGNYFEKMLSLQELDISTNNFNGSIPKSLGKLSSLKTLVLRSNKFSGLIPTSLGALSSLEKLDLSDNDLSGSISDMFFEKMLSLGELDISNNHLNGSIPTSLGKLSSLKILCLEGNKFSGTIPASIEMLSSLQQLHFSSNEFSGSISDNYFEKMLSLQELDISRNYFNGSIPTSLGKLSVLRMLLLQNNKFSGLIPTSLGDLHLLTNLLLSSNNFSGPIPTSIWKLRSLRELDISDNGLEGNIPESVCQMSSLERLLFFGNDKIKGTLPRCLGQLTEMKFLGIGGKDLEVAFEKSDFLNMTNLRELRIVSSKSLVMNFSSNWIPPFRLTTLSIVSTNMRTEFPMWIQSQDTLGELTLSHSGIFGNLPTWIWNFSSEIVRIDLSNNEMSGVLPNPLYAGNLNEIDLSENKFQGSNWLHTVSEMIPFLYKLTLSWNNLDGNIPSSLCNLINLMSLDLSGNNFSGEIPDCLMKIGYTLKLANNKLQGKLPSLIIDGYCPMESLHLENNNLSGILPSSWKNCTDMEVLDLSRNKLNGNIPIWLTETMFSLRVLRLRDNNFFGNIPQELSKLTSLQVLDLAYNNFSGSIPHTFGNFTAMKFAQTVNGSARPLIYFMYPEKFSVYTKGNEMVYWNEMLLLVRSIDLSSNRLFGEIPNELGDLVYLNLSQNHLSSSIPRTLGKLNTLETLDLSRNDLTGEIPKEMSLMSSLNHLNLSYNNLSRWIPMDGQFATFKNTSFLGNPNLCGNLSGHTCENDLRPKINGIGHKKSKVDREMLWICVSMLLGFVIGFWLFYGMLIINQGLRYRYFGFLSNVNYKLYKCFY